MNATAIWTVLGMNCDHCVGAVTKQVEAIAGVTGVEVALATGKLRVTSHQPLDDAAVRAAIVEAGFEVK
jgi:copper chaperone